MARMKIKQEHFDYLKQKIEKMWAANGKSKEFWIEVYKKGDFVRSDKVKNLHMRFCFDCLYGAVKSKWICDNLYPYMNDVHIFTALKKICPDPNKN